MIENDDLIPEFLAEANELIEKVYQDTDKLSLGADLQALLESIFRSIHTIKGGSGMFNFANTQAVAHSLESFLSQIKSATPLAITEKDIAFIRDETQKIEALLKAQDKIREGQSKEAVSGSKDETSESKEAASESRVPPESKDETSESKVAAFEQVPAEMTQKSSPVQDVVSPPVSPVPQEKEQTLAQTIDYIRVPVQRINESMNCIAEIFLIRNQMVHLMEKRKTGLLDQRDFYQAWDQLDGALRRGIGELERSTMNMRMASVQGLFSRMARVVQSYKAAHKKIEFLTMGDSTELDKKVLDTLAEPLIHLIRNSMDHGIESAEERTKKGKTPHGTITLRAAIVGNEAIVEVSDDGKGIDPQVILSVAKKKGLDTSDVTDDRSAIDLIFRSGFSTAQSVSEISGRGVGMDAVKSSVQALGGKIQIQTAVGKGSTFTIKLPVSVSVSPVVIVNIRGLKYAVPNQDILEIRQTSLRNVSSNAGKQFVMFRNAFIECVDLRDQVKAETKDHEENMSEASFLFFKFNEKIYAARVSSFEVNTEIVVKPPSKLFPTIPWIGGVSVLPTGEAIFVLSLSRIFETTVYQEAQHVA